MTYTVRLSATLMFPKESSIRQYMISDDILRDYCERVRWQWLF